MKKYLRVVLKGTPVLWYDLEMADDVVMNQLVAQLQMAGYILAPKVFVPYDSIAHMCLIDVRSDEQPLDFTKAGKLQ
jgi:hypothetical protein